MAAINQLLNYVATYPNDNITYSAIIMVLAGHSDAYFLNERKDRIWAGDQIFLSEGFPIPINNIPLLTLSQIIKLGMSSAAKSELASLFITANQMAPLRQTLTKIGWNQPHSFLQAEKLAATGVTNNTNVLKLTKAMYICSHWLL